MVPVLRFVVFVLPVAVTVWAVERVARPLWPEAIGPTLVERIDRSFHGATTRRYDILIVGNSRMYRGVNPDEIGSAYNFGQDDDAFNQVYYKLLYLERHGVTYSSLVIGVDYFEFSFLPDRRNAAYAKFLGDAYLSDYQTARPDGWRAAMDKVLHPIDENAFNDLMVRYCTRPASLLLSRALATIDPAPVPPPIRAVLKENGQYILDAGPLRVDPIRRDARRLPIQERYFLRILEWARARGLSMLLVMPPVRRLELDAYDPHQLAAFDRWLAEQAARYGATYLNLSRHPAFSDADFADITHLNEAAADRFSRLIARSLPALTATVPR